MERIYGKNPCSIVTIHGGPGAIGSLKGFAQELSLVTGEGVLEALQTKYSLPELIDELFVQVKENCTEKVTLIGHSFGAWLAVLFTEKYPEYVQNVIMVGSGPLEDSYVSQISERRTVGMSEEDKAIYERLYKNQATSEDLEKLSQLKTDDVCPIDEELHSADFIDSKMMNTVWPEAALLRNSGVLLESFRNLTCRLILIQGEQDPHPYKGITEPLAQNGIACETYLLKECGHSPFKEKHAKEEFFQILKSLLCDA